MPMSVIKVALGKKIMQKENHQFSTVPTTTTGITMPTVPTTVTTGNHKGTEDYRKQVCEI
jgi:hypothetical protein